MTRLPRPTPNLPFHPPPSPTCRCYGAWAWPGVSILLTLLVALFLCVTCDGCCCLGPWIHVVFGACGTVGWAVFGGVYTWQVGVDKVHAEWVGGWVGGGATAAAGGRVDNSLGQQHGCSMVNALHLQMPHAERAACRAALTPHPAPHTRRGRRLTRPMTSVCPGRATVQPS